MKIDAVIWRETRFVAVKSIFRLRKKIVGAIGPPHHPTQIYRSPRSYFMQARSL